MVCIDIFSFFIVEIITSIKPLNAGNMVITNTYKPFWISMKNMTGKKNTNKKFNLKNQLGIEFIFWFILKNCIFFSCAVR